MDDVTREGRTVLLVSHNMTSIASLCSRTLLLEDGQIAMDDVTTDVIGRYVSSIRQASGEIVWDDPSEAPQNDEIRLHGVRTMLPDGTVTSELDIQDEVVVQVSYWNLVEGKSPHVTVTLYDDLGNRVLSSGNLPTENTGVDEWFGSPFPRGLFATECRIPANLLNKRTYTVGVGVSTAIGRPGVAVEVRDVLTFTVHDRQGNEYWTRWGGSVHPKLAWSTVRLQKPDTSDQTESAESVS
jgi:lipopolysaccharide transport system ATP-binding protein